LRLPSRACGIAIHHRVNRVYVATSERVDGGDRRHPDVNIEVNPLADGLFVVNKTGGSLVAAGGDLSPS
jgi:hypothetical protein